MKKIILLLVLLPILSKAQINLSASTLTVKGETCSGTNISINGNYLADGKVNDRYQFSQTLNLQAPNYQLCFNNTLYSVPSNKFIIRWNGKWQLGFISTVGQQNNFVVISFDPLGSYMDIDQTPTCDIPMFEGVINGTPNITGNGCLGSTLTASAYGATGFQWYKDSNAILGATNTTFTPNEEGNYQVATTFDDGYWIPTANSPILPLFNQPIDVYFINSTTGWVLGNNSQIYKSTSAGDSWTQLTTGVTTNLNAISFTDLNNGVAVGASGEIIRTTNGGDTWQAVSSTVTNNLTDVFFLNANTGWAVGSQYVVLKTSDGGATWNKISMDNSALTTDTYNEIQFTDSNTGYVTGSSPNNNISFINNSIDGGVSWTTSKSVSGKFLIRNLSFIDNNIGWIGGFKNSGTFPEVSKTVDAGTNWLNYSALINPTYQNMNTSSLHFIDANRGWILSSNSNSKILTTKDGGNTFYKGSSFLPYPSEYYASKIFMLPTGSSGWIVGRNMANSKQIMRYSNIIFTSNAVNIQSSVGKPTLSQTGTAYLCPEGSLTLIASGCSGTVNWSTGATTTSIIIQSAGTYTATCETVCGISEASLSLIVEIIPSTKALFGTATSEVQRAGTITSTQNIPVGISSTYSAGKSVTLSPTFKTENGSVFLAEIKNCN